MRPGILALVMIFCLLLDPASATASAAGPSDPVELGGFLDGVFAAQMRADHVPGAVVAVVKDGQVLYLKGYGCADVKAGAPVDPHKTLFRIGSTSKLLTWTAVMQLVEQGKLELNTDVNAYLDFQIPSTFPQPITLRHLLSHTPGFEEVTQDPFKIRPADNLPLDAFLKKNIPARVFAPGTVSAYSNYGAALAGYIVERAAGMPFDQYVDRNITAPLGMARSTFVQPLPPRLSGDMSAGYNYVNGEYLQGAFEIIPPYPAGGFSATAADMARFMIAHLQDGRFEEARILKPSTAMLMHSSLYSQDPALHGMAYGFFEDEVNGQRVISHGGDTILFHSGLYLLPDQNLGIFLSTNAASGAASIEPVFHAFMDHYYPPASSEAPSLEEPASPEAPDFAARAPLYTGEYYFSRSSFSGPAKIARLAGAIHVQAGPQGRVTLSGLGPHPYRYTEVAPGQLEAGEGPLPTLVLRVQPAGQVFLLTSLPWELIKAPWYATSTLHGLIFIGGLLLFLVTLAAWLARFIRERRRGAPVEPLGARLARGAAALFMLGYIALLLSLLGILLDFDPVYGVPRAILGEMTGLNLILALPPILAVLGAAALIFTALAWIKRYGSAAGRAYYTLLLGWFAALLWAMWYWNGF